jgi:xylose isomerase
MTDKYKPLKSDRFAFGLWCVTNRGRDPFGSETRPQVDPLAAMRGLARRGVYGFEYHDNDLVPFDAGERERRKTVAAVKRVMRASGIRATAGTTNLFAHPVFRDGAFTSHDPEVRAFAVQKALRLIDLAAELQTRVILLWGGREGAEVDAAKDPVTALGYYRQCVNFLCEYIIDRRYRMLLSIEPKPNEPRGDMYLPTTGHALAFIETLEHPFLVGVNPEVAHVKMAGLNPYHEFAQAIEVGKLLDVHLNGQKIGRFDQDLALGADDIKDIFFVVKLLKDHGYRGTVAFDAHPYRTEVEPWDFVERCMRTYKMLAEKVDRLNRDAEYRRLMRGLAGQAVGRLLASRRDSQIGGCGATALQGGPLAAALADYSAKGVAALRGHAYRLDQMAARPLPYERIDQIVTEILLGVR